MALLAVLCAQVFGLSEGYVCVCHGDVLIPESTQCHHGHSHSERDACCDTGKDHSTHEHSEHKPLKKDIKAASLVKAPAAPDLMVADLPETFLAESFDRPWAAAAVRPEFILCTEGIPPAGLLVARCLVMLV